MVRGSNEMISGKIITGKEAQKSILAGKGLVVGTHVVGDLIVNKKSNIDNLSLNRITIDGLLRLENLNIDTLCLKETIVEKGLRVVNTTIKKDFLIVKTTIKGCLDFQNITIGNSLWFRETNINCDMKLTGLKLANLIFENLTLFLPLDFLQLTSERLCFIKTTFLNSLKITKGTITNIEVLETSINKFILTKTTVEKMVFENMEI